MVFTIYGLYDPVEPERVRYVGKTRFDPAVRLSNHISGTLDLELRSYRLNWLRKVLLEGRAPEIFTMNETSTEENANALEKVYIREYRKAGHKLTNATEGGEGSLGWVPSVETRAKISIANKGNKSCVGRNLSSETRAKISVALRGQKHSKETRTKIGDAQKGRKLSAEWCANISVGLKGKKLSAGTRIKIGAALKGRKRSAESIAKSAAGHKGLKHSKETRLKISLAHLRNSHAKLEGAIK